MKKQQGEKKSNELFEDDYEGYWKEHDLLDEEAAGRKEESRAVRNRMRLRVSKKAKDQFSRSAVPDKVQQRVTGKRKPRKSAELVIVPAGNRDGVLEGFSIKCVPGYCWKILREDLSTKEIKEIIKSEEQTEEKDAKRERRSKKDIDPLARPGQGFGP